ncbi:ArnT family glycosyltransferase [Neobacillus sp. NPDC058068]|uniref:ArnT family glycosyltransferase n=1 Tax=Neobacillus sp. NPDC058068 TaxID=3346325 RepID=UPI0036DD6BE7
MYRSIRKLFNLYFLVMMFLFTLAFFNIFYKLGDFPIYSWDEARHGINAYEMFKKGNYIVSTYMNSIDYWNLKPPLSFWANIAGFNLAGFNAYGLRLFSAISAMLTIIVTAAFTYKTFGKIASMLTTLTLTTCTQLLINHSARTGDADSLFVFFFTFAIISLLLSEQGDIWLYLSGVAFALAFLTKSWHAGNIAGIIGLYLLLNGRWKRLTSVKWLLLLHCMFLPIIIWGSLRYQYDGIEFFKTMINYDLLHRSSSPIEGHVGGKFFYFQVFWRFFKFWLILLVGLVFVYFFKDLSFDFLKTKKRATIIGIGLWLLIPFLLFTFVKTKIRWYILPVYPPLAILIGIMGSRLLLNGKLISKAFLVFFVIMISVHYEWRILLHLNNQTPKFHLSLIQSLHKMEELKGKSLFMYHPTGKPEWEQNIVLTAKLYGDFNVEDGDLNDFLQTDGALLLLKKRKYTDEILKSNNLIVVASNNWGYIVRKNLKLQEDDQLVLD